MGDAGAAVLAGVLPQCSADKNWNCRGTRSLVLPGAQAHALPQCGVGEAVA